jgi:hypothetical protein
MQGEALIEVAWQLTSVTKAKVQRGEGVFYTVVVYYLCNCVLHYSRESQSLCGRFVYLAIILSTQVNYVSTPSSR